MDKEPSQEVPKKKGGCFLAVFLAGFGLVVLFIASYALPGYRAYRERENSSQGIHYADKIRLGLINHAANADCRCFPSSLSGYEAIQGLLSGQGTILPEKMAEAHFKEILYKAKSPNSFKLLVAINTKITSRKLVLCTPEKCVTMKERPKM